MQILRLSSYLLLPLVAASTTMSLPGCGSDGAVAAPGIGRSTWEPGVFVPATQFQARCASPRSGINPITDQPYPDVQGTTTDENNFLRSYSHDTYLWYDEIVDQDPSLFDSPVAYFDELRTNATTPSGRPRDQFHFSVDTAEYLALSQSGTAAGYGVQWALLSTTPPREILVAYTEPGSPATDPQVGLARGARVLEVDGFDIDIDTQEGVNALNAALFPPLGGETHSFVVQDVGSETSRSITMTSAVVQSEPVKNVRVLETSTGRVGYMLFNDHIATAETGLINAVNQLAAGEGIDDLVLDIRYNGGGFLAIAGQLGFMIAGPEATAERVFELSEFNDKHPTTDPVTGSTISPTPFYNRTLGFNETPDQPLPSLDLRRVFVITSASTCSASEAIINGLRGVDIEVIQIGSTTCGKPYGFYPTDNCGTTYFTIQFRTVNDKGFGDYADGFAPADAATDAGVGVPGCTVSDDFSAELGHPDEDRLAVALSYRDTGDCSALPQAAGVAKDEAGRPREPVVPKSIWHTNRIMRP